jgi:antitoxin ParD1/3/4
VGYAARAPGRASTRDSTTSGRHFNRVDAHVKEGEKVNFRSRRTHPNLEAGMRKAYRWKQRRDAKMSTVEKMTIALTPEMASFVRSAVNAGEYASTSEAIREAVREWKERKDLLGYTVEELRELVQEGIDSGLSELLTMEDVKAEARRRFEALKRKV